MIVYCDESSVIFFLFRVFCFYVSAVIGLRNTYCLRDEAVTKLGQLFFLYCASVICSVLFCHWGFWFLLNSVLHFSLFGRLQCLFFLQRKIIDCPPIDLPSVATFHNSVFMYSVYVTVLVPPCWKYPDWSYISLTGLW